FVGLLIATLTTWTTPLTFQSGKAAYAKYEEGPIKTFLDKDAEKYLEIHEERAEIGVIPIYSAAILSTLLLILLIFLPHFSRIFSLISIITCTLACASGIWIADSGGKIRRPDFRISQNQSLEIKTDSNLTNPKNEEKEEESEGKEHE
ncbi:MAG: hypothetical protein NZL93_00450, partial [Chthoniobacterales bacterium]|nr:hypothetical protein [Chthoniobacterales bacterium]